MHSVFYLGLARAADVRFHLPSQQAPGEGPTRSAQPGAPPSALDDGEHLGPAPAATALANAVTPDASRGLQSASPTPSRRQSCGTTEARQRSGRKVNPPLAPPRGWPHMPAAIASTASRDAAGAPHPRTDRPCWAHFRRRLFRCSLARGRAPRHSRWSPILPPTHAAHTRCRTPTGSRPQCPPTKRRAADKAPNRPIPPSSGSTIHRPICHTRSPRKGAAAAPLPSLAEPSPVMASTPAAKKKTVPPPSPPPTLNCPSPPAH